MDCSSRKRMKASLKLLCLVLLAAICLFLILGVSGVFALAEVGVDSMLAPYLLSHFASGILAVVPLLVFIRLVQSVVRSKEFFSKKQSQRMLTIAICFALRVVLDLLVPSIEVPALHNGAIGPMSIGSSLNLTMLAVAIMFFALAGVFEYGRKLQEDSDNIL